MLYFIETPEDFKYFLEEIKSKVSVSFMFLSDIEKPAIVNSVAVLFVFIGSDIYVLSKNHPEHNTNVNDWESKLKFKKTIVPSKIEFSYFFSSENVIDSQCMDFMRSEKPFISDKPAALNKLYSNHKISNVNLYAPIMKLLENATAYYEHIKETYDPHYLNETWNDHILPVYYEIEKSGLAVLPEELKLHYGDKISKFIYDDIVYSKVNPFNITGRPSNSAHGINFMAINKHDGTRASFVSRFKRDPEDGERDGKLILIDYESYHLRLISDLIGFPQPEEPFHEYLGRIYVGDSHLTQEQYDKGKQATFSYLYGEEKPPYSIEFFDKVGNFIKSTWDEVQRTGILVYPVSGRELKLSTISSPTPQKIFNYLVQGMETETSLSTIENVLHFFKENNLESKIILYNYDSILIDFSIKDAWLFWTKTGIILVREIERIMSQKYPVRIYMGSDYNAMFRLDPEEASAV